jgi:hypothetical protein
MEGDPEPKQKQRENNQQNSFAENQKQYLRDNGDTFKWIAGLWGQQWWTRATVVSIGGEEKKLAFGLWTIVVDSGNDGRNEGEENRVGFGLWAAVVEKWGRARGLAKM